MPETWSCHSEQEPLPTRVLKNIRAREKFFLIKKNQVLCGYQKSHPSSNPSNRLSGRLFDTAATVVPLPFLRELNSFLIKLFVKSGD